MGRTIESVASRFDRGKIGSIIRYFEEINSTNALALRMPIGEIAHGLVLVAGSQTAGRGRQGRSWLSLPDAGLHFTVIIVPAKQSLSIIPFLGLVGALAVHDTLATFCKGKLDIKWPNDVLLNHKKISGILGETATGGRGINRIALGISVNVSHSENDFPAEFRHRSTSILIEEGSAPDLKELLTVLLMKLNERYDQLLVSGAAVIAEETRDRSSYVHGKRLRIALPAGEQIVGTSAGLNDDGTLQLRLDSGAEISLSAGDVHLL